MLRAGLAVAVGLVVGCAGLRHREPEFAGRDYPTLESDDQPINPYAEHNEQAERPGLGFVPAAERQVGDDIPVDFDIGDPRGVEQLVVNVHVGSFYRLPSAPNHLVTYERGGVQRVTVKAAPGAAVAAEDCRPALVATVGIDSDSDRIRTAAIRATRDDRDERERVASLVGWIYTHISYVIGDETVASNVLAHGTGDCSEMSLLFVAMARAVGIPARRVVGLAATYSNGGPAFGYHAWAEVALDGHWVQVDPTWNEEIADATHIELQEGDGDYWGVAADGLELEVIDVKRQPGDYDSDPRTLARELPVHLRLCHSRACREH